LIQELGQEIVPNETKPGQTERIARLAKAEAAGRRKMKEMQSSKKASRRTSGRGDD
jgi:peptidyl-tRNA hydrolase ICT1